MPPTITLKTLLFFTVLACIVGAPFGMQYAASALSSSDVKREAAAFVKECSGSGEDHSQCYESEVPNLFPKFSVPKIFDIVREIRKEDPSYQFCHVLGHLIGERVVAEDPQAWVNAIPLNPTDGLCSNGFIHGVIGGRFRADVLDEATTEKFLPQFKEACAPHDSWQPSRLDRAMCYHGMGHLFLFITNAAVPRALSLCDKVTPDEYRRVCVQGVFMQIYQPLEPDDFALIEQMAVQPTRENVRDFCAAYAADPMAEGSCLEESWPLFRENIMQGGARSFCSGQPNEVETQFCYIGASSIVGRMTLGDSERAVRACTAFPEKWQGTCFSYSAEAVLQEDRNDSTKAIALCEKAPAHIAQECVAQLVDHAAFTFGQNASAYKNFCASLSGGEKEKCVRDLRSGAKQ